MKLSHVPLLLVSLASTKSLTSAFSPSSSIHRNHFRSSSNSNLAAPAPLHQSASSTADLAPGISTINELNSELEPKLDLLRTQPYFRLYSVDMLGSCEYMPQELFECYSETCEIYPVDEDEVTI